MHPSVNGRRRLCVGLTGNMGCGKSTAAGIFAAEGWRVVDCDALVADLLAKDPGVAAAVAGRWGRDALLPGGGVDKAKAAARIFSDEAERLWFESILHPKVREGWKQAAAGEGPSLVEVPLLFEKNLEMNFDYTVCLYASVDIQVARLGRRGFGPGEALRRLSVQMPLDLKASKADFVLLNDGSLEFLTQQVRHITRQLI